MGNLQIGYKDSQWDLQVGANLRPLYASSKLPQSDIDEPKLFFFLINQTDITARHDHVSELPF